MAKYVCVQLTQYWCTCTGVYGLHLSQLFLAGVLCTYYFMYLYMYLHVANVQCTSTHPHPTCVNTDSLRSEALSSIPGGCQFFTFSKNTHKPSHVHVHTCIYIYIYYQGFVHTCMYMYMYIYSTYSLMTVAAVSFVTPADTLSRKRVMNCLVSSGDTTWNRDTTV